MFENLAKLINKEFSTRHLDLLAVSLLLSHPCIGWIKLISHQIT